MNDQTTSNSARVIQAYQAPYTDPIRASAGEEVSVDRARTTQIPGWLWCTNARGKSGWVPAAYLDQRGDTARLLCDYDALELTIQVGDRLICHKEESGFWWVTNQAGQNGWVPSECIQRTS